MKIQEYAVSFEELPVDLFADPDGEWSYEELVAAAGLDPDVVPPHFIGALTEAWRGHPDGAAVIAASVGGERRVTVIECVSTGTLGRIFPEEHREAVGVDRAA